MSEPEAGMVETMHERKIRNIYFRVTSVEYIYPFTFIPVIDLIGRKISTKDVLRKIMYANDLATTAQKKTGITRSAG